MFTIWGKADSCTCNAPRDHPQGQCPEGCLCARCACTCTTACTVGGSLDRPFGGCGCGCPHHGS